MTTPANLTFTDIQTRVMNNLRLPTTNTTEAAKVAAVINEVYRDVWLKHDWWFFEKRYPFNTVPAITAGTVSVTANSTAVTFSTIPQRFAANVALQDPDNMLFIPGNAQNAQAIYRIATHTAGAVGATLDAAYTGATDTAAGYRVSQDLYPLPADTGKVLAVTRDGATAPLERVGLETMSAQKQWDRTNGPPWSYTIHDYQNTGDPSTVRLLWLHPYPDQAYRVVLTYKQQLNTELSSTTQPLIPDEYRHILVYGALARGYPIFHKDAERGGVFQSLFNDLLALMVAQHKEYARDAPAVVPQNDYRTRRAGRSRGATTLGSWFDRLPYAP